MLQSMTLKNWQNFDEFTVEFDPRVTTFVGPTDSGKTSLLRALGWLCLNKPSGDAFIKDGKSSTSGKLVVDGKTVRRKRGKGTNVYYLDNKEYRAFGNKVPDDIASLLNVDQINFQRQMDLPFWFTETPGQVSRNLNEIVNLSSIDTTLSNVASVVRKARDHLEVCNARVMKAKEDKAGLKWVKEFLEDFREFEKARKQYQEVTRLLRRINDLVVPARSAELRLGILSQAILDAKDVEQIGERYASVTRKTKGLRKLLTEAKDAKKAIETDVPEMTVLSSVRAEADAVAERRRKLEYFLEELKKQDGAVCQLEKAVASTSRTLQKVSPKNCPACGRPMPKSAPSSSVTSTLRPKHLCPVPKKTTGSKSPNSTSIKSVKSPKSTVPW